MARFKRNQLTFSLFTGTNTKKAALAAFFLININKIGEWESVNLLSSLSPII